MSEPNKSLGQILFQYFRIGCLALIAIILFIIIVNRTDKAFDKYLPEQTETNVYMTDSQEVYNVE